MPSHAASVPVPCRRAASARHMARLEPMDMFLLSLVDGVLSMSELCDIMPCGRDETRQRAQKLVGCGLVELSVGGAQPAGMHPGGGAPVSEQRPLEPHATRNELCAVEALLDELDELDAFSLLGVSADASLRDLRAACARLKVEPRRPLTSVTPPPSCPSHMPAIAGERSARAEEPGPPGPFADPPSTVRMRPWPAIRNGPSSEDTQLGHETPVAALRVRALHAEAACQWNQAVSSWREVLGREPDSRMACLRLAHCLLESGSARLALRHAREAVRRMPRDLEARLLLGRVYETVGLSLSARQERDVACDLNRRGRSR